MSGNGIGKIIPHGMVFVMDLNNGNTHNTATTFFVL
jgi:hypothetical protein